MCETRWINRRFTYPRLPNGLMNLLKDAREQPIILSTASLSEDNRGSAVVPDVRSRMVESRTCRLGHRHFKVNRLRHQSSGSSSAILAPSSTLSTHLSNNVHELRTYPSVDRSSSEDGDCDTDNYYHQIEKKWEISRCNLMLDKVIGEGEFGLVRLGTLVENSLASGKI